MNQKGELKKVAITELVEDYHLYPRSEVDGAAVEEFREALRAGAKFPPIRVCSKTLRIIDGFHRKTAYERERATHVLCSLEEVEDDRDLFRRAAQANAHHGRRYSVDDYATAVRLAKRLGLTREQISADLFLPLDRVEKLERISAGRGHEPPKRNIPSSGAKSSRLVEKSMDTISQLTWATSLLRCIREGHVNEKSEELRTHLEELSEVLGEYLSRPRAGVPAPTHRVYTRMYPPEDRQAVKAA
jgi:ParB-like chromosome segregation protein Spo0J